MMTRQGKDLSSHHHDLCDPLVSCLVHRLMDGSELGVSF